jgi:hypothetical protein
MMALTPKFIEVQPQRQQQKGNYQKQRLPPAILWAIFHPLPNEGHKFNNSPLVFRHVIIALRSDNMLRTQISLEERDYKLVKKEAESLGVSVAEYVRRAIQNTLPPKGRAAWMRYAGLVESGNPNSSLSIDEIVYGHKD